MKKVSFIGCGKMAGAILSSLLDGGRSPQTLCAADKSETALEQFSRAGVFTTTDNRVAAERADIIFLAVKPQHIEPVLTDLAGLENGKTVVSIVTGISTDRLRERLPKAGCIVRVMPNTPMLLGMGAAAVAFGDADESVRSEVAGLFAGCGEVFPVEEKYLNAVTALSGSGPAYFYRIAAVMAEAASQTGLDRAEALELCAKTMEGAAAMLRRSGKLPAELIRDVSSPGGTTLAALAAFDDNGLDDALRAGVCAAERRAEELGKAR